MNEFRFANMIWLHAMWGVVLLIAIRVALEFRGRRALDRLVSPAMQSRLVTRTSLGRRLTAFALWGLCLASLVLAMMRPQWGMTIQAATRIDSQVMICLDVSKSMLAEDVAPNRLERAKAELETLLSLMDDGQHVGLIAFAGRAAVLCPMTTDFGFLRLMLQDVSPGSIGRGGTRIGEALGKAVDGFRDAGDVNRVVLLITDGEDHDSFPLDAAKVARERGIRVVCIGFGDEAGSRIEITDPDTGARSFLKDRNGDDVLSRLDGETLREIALETEGAYVPAGTGALDLGSIYDAHIKTLMKGSTKAEDRVLRNEAFQWCILASLVFLVLAVLAAHPFAIRNRALAASPVARIGPAVPSASRLAGWALMTSLAYATPMAVAATDNPTGDPPRAANARDAATDAAPTGNTTDSETVPRPTTGRGRGRAADESADNTEPTPTEQQLLPREAFNLAVACLSSDPGRAERLLNQARRDAGIDGELRFRSTYNLGWVEIHRSDAVLADDPEQALKHLEQAAGRFREAIRVRPDSLDARHNLEVVSKRILELTDSLAQRNPLDLEARLDAVIDSQRQQLLELRTLLDRAAATEAGPDDPRTRGDFRAAAIGQRHVLADLQGFANAANRELEALDQQDTAELTEPQQLRRVQLEAMRPFIEQARQRLHKARGLTRRRQGSRAFQRWAAALNQTKRARDQLRNPVDVLSVLIQDGTELARLTQQMALAERAVLAGQDDADVPTWLTAEFLEDSQSSLNQRIAELEDKFQAFAENSTGSADDGNPTTPAGDPNRANADQSQQIANLRGQVAAAMPHLDTARTELTTAGTHLEATEYSPAIARQAAGLAALHRAWEQFFDVRRLIERIHQQQVQITDVVRLAFEHPEASPRLVESVDLEQQQNFERCERLAQMFADELAKLEASQVDSEEQDPTASPSGADAAAAGDSERRRYQLATVLLDRAVHQAKTAHASLKDWGESPRGSAREGNDHTTASQRAGDARTGSGAEDEGSTPADEQHDPASAAASGDEGADADADASKTRSPDSTEAPDNTEAPDDTEAPPPDDTEASDGTEERIDAEFSASVATLEDLRRLFFSLVEHLRDTAQRQAQLHAETAEQTAGQDPAPTALGPLANRQQELERIASELSNALADQADDASQAAAAAPPTGAPDAEESRAGHPAPEQLREQAEKLAAAATLVEEGGQAMATAAQSLSATVSSTSESDELDDVLAVQQTAVEKLLAALELLDDRPPPEQQPEAQNQDQSEQDDDQQQEESAQSQESAPQPQEPSPEQEQQNLDANQLLQLIRDREAERRKDKRRKQQASSTPVDKDW